MTFSHPQFALYQTAPYTDDSKGKDISTAIVGGGAPVEDETELVVPDAIAPAPPAPIVP